MSHLITLHHGQLPVDVAGLHLIPGKAVPVEGDEVPAEVLALRPRVKMTIKRVHALPAPAEDGLVRRVNPALAAALPAPAEDGPEREGGPDTAADDEPAEPPKKPRAARS